VADPLPVGADVVLALRPEQIAMSVAHESPTAERNGIRGKVTAVVYRGTISTYFVTSPGGRW